MQGEIVNAGDDTQAALQDMAITNEAAKMIQNSAAMLTFSTMLVQHGPEKMQTLLTGLSRIGNLPARKP
jgi:hypothetical protein